MSIRLRLRRRRRPKGLALALAARAGLALGLLALGVAACELFVRVADPAGVSARLDRERYERELCEPAPPPRLYRHRAGASAALSAFRVRTDARGARGPERATPKPEHVQRMLFLGDGVTFGWGVDEEDSFVALVEGLLRRDAGEAWETVNLGHVGYDAARSLAAFDEHGALYEPDVIVLVRGDERPLAPAPAAALGCAASACVRAHLPYLSALASACVAGAPEERDAAPLATDLEAERAALLALQARARERGAPLIVLALAPDPALAELCSSEGLAYASIALTPEERASGASESDAAGQRILARNVRASLLGLGLL